MLPFMYILLLAGLGLAVLTIVLLVVVHMVRICTRSRSSSDDETGGNGYEEEPFVVSYERPGARFGSLHSRPSAPSLSHLDQDGARSTPKQSVSEDHCIEDIRAIQNSLTRNGIIYKNDDDLNCNVIIGIDANPQVFGGYYINLKEKLVDFYSIKASDLPWHFSLQTDWSEFEMKNFLFALMLWSEKILEGRRLLIYTGNHAINHDNNRYSRRVVKLLEHYSACEGVTILNDNRHHVNRKQDPKAFSTFIQPAEDLSMWNLSCFRDFISDYYAVDKEQFQGSHLIPPTTSSREQARYESTINYQLYIIKVREAMKGWMQPCNKCGYVDDETASVAASMLSINRIS